MYTVKEAAARTGLDTATVVSFEKQKLIPAVARNEQNRRVYSDEDLDLIMMVSRLRYAGLSNAEIREYMALFFEGPSTLPTRRSMIADRRDEIHKQISKLAQASAFLGRELDLVDAAAYTADMEDMSWQHEAALHRSLDQGEMFVRAAAKRLEKKNSQL